MLFPLLVIAAEQGDRLEPANVFALFGILTRINFSVILTASLGATGLAEFLAFMKRLNTVFLLEDY